MTPKWHHKTYDWTGTVSTDWFNIDNWQVNGTTPDYFYDAGSYLIINQTGNNPSIASADTTYCSKLKVEINATITLNNSILKVGK